MEENSQTRREQGTRVRQAERLEFDTHEDISNQLFFINGLTRSGKSVFSGIVPSFERTEHLKFFELIENVLPAIEHGAVDPNYARSLLGIVTNEMAYNTMISRKINFRPGDQTGILNTERSDVYIERLTKEEGGEVVQELRDSDRIFPFQTHQLMVHYDILEQMDLGYKMLELFRHPVDNVYSWWKRGWGERYGEDPRAFTLTLTYDGHSMPWWAVSHRDEWVERSPPERSIMDYCLLIERIVSQFHSSDNTDNVLVTTFEDSVVNPKKNVERLVDFLDTNESISTDFEIRKAGCPRKQEDLVERRKRRKSELCEEVAPELFDRLMDLSRRYEENLYELDRL